MTDPIRPQPGIMDIALYQGRGPRMWRASRMR